VERMLTRRPVGCSSWALYAAAEHRPRGQILASRRHFQDVVGDFAAENVGFRLVGTDIVHCVRPFRAPTANGAKEKTKGAVASGA
jgi:hypothetical protein